MGESVSWSPSPSHPWKELGESPAWHRSGTCPRQPSPLSLPVSRDSGGLRCGLGTFHAGCVLFTPWALFGVGRGGRDAVPVEGSGVVGDSHLHPTNPHSQAGLLSPVCVPVWVGVGTHPSLGVSFLL